MEGAVLGPNSIVKGSIVGPGFKVGPDARVIDSVVAVQ